MRILDAGVGFGWQARYSQERLVTVPEVISTTTLLAKWTELHIWA